MHLLQKVGLLDTIFGGKPGGGGGSGSRFLVMVTSLNSESWKWNSVEVYVTTIQCFIV